MNEIVNTCGISSSMKLSSVKLSSKKLSSEMPSSKKLSSKKPSSKKLSSKKPSSKKLNSKKLSSKRFNSAKLVSTFLVTQILVAVCIFIFGNVFSGISSVNATTVLTNPNETLEYGKTYSGRIEGREEEQNNYYRYNFKLTSTGTIKINLDNQYADENGIILITLYDTTLTRLSVKDLKYGANEVSYVLMPGDYYFVLENKEIGYFGNFSFKAEYIDNQEKSMETYEKRNDTKYESTKVKVGKPFNGAIALKDELDVYKFTLKKDGYLTYKINSNDLKGYTLKLENVNGDVNITKSNLKIGEHKYTYYVPQGTYYLTVDSFVCYGTYTISTALNDLPIVKLKKINKVKKAQFRVNWAKNKFASGYQVQVSTDENFKKGKKTITFNGRNKKYGVVNSKNGKLQRKKKYYVRVRAFAKVSGGKMKYSAWSNAKKVKTK